MLLKIILFLLPAYFANMAPILVKNKFLFINIPVDFNKTLFGQPIFGKNKTVRGFIAGIIASIGIVWIEQMLFHFDFMKKLSLINYDQQNFLILGFLFGFGTLFGDLIKSFFKRRLKIDPGQSIKIIDQIDYVVGSLFFISVVYVPSLDIVILSIFISLILTIMINHLAYYFHFRDEKW